MIRLILLALLAAPLPAAADWCSGLVTSNGSCIGSQGNVDPPTLECDGSGQCWHRR